MEKEGIVAKVRSRNLGDASRKSTISDVDPSVGAQRSDSPCVSDSGTMRWPGVGFGLVEKGVELLPLNEAIERSEVEKSSLVMTSHENEDPCDPGSRPREGKD